MVWNDIRHACRTLRRSPAFTTTALLVLALGIGATTTVYAVVRGIALRPLPFDEPGRLMFIGELSPTGRREAAAPANVVDLTRQTRAFEHIALYRGARFILSGRAVPESVNGATVSSGFFSALRIQPARGRPFVVDDDQPGRPRVAMLSHAGWTRYFSQDPAIVGRAIVLDGLPCTVIGVLPVGVSLFESDIWVAGFDAPLLSSRVTRNTGALGRLAPGVTPEQARAELDIIGRRLAETYPSTNAGWTFRSTPLQDAWLGAYRSTSALLLVAVGALMLIACANVAGLLLERALSRDRDVMIRLAIGAPRKRIVQQMLTESVLLALLGGGIGVLVAWWFIGIVVTLIPANTLTQIPGGAGAIHLDLHTVVVALVASVVAGMLFGLMPALRIARSDAAGALRGAARGGASGGRQVWRRALTVSQVALSAILLSGALLMLHTLWSLEGLDRGYDPDNALRISLAVPPERYPQPEQRNAFFAAVIERIGAFPGVTSVAGMTLISSRGRPFTLEGQSLASRDAAPLAVFRVATGNYFSTIGTPLVRGRAFSAEDGAAAPPVAIVNQTFARLAWPARDPIGQRVRLLGSPADLWVTVIGVAGDVKEMLDPRAPLQLDARPTIYRPVSQEPVASMMLIVRTERDPSTLVAISRAAVAAVDPSIPPMSLATLRQDVSDSVQTPRFTAALFTGFASLALLLAAVGMYGAIACAVQQRTREIGIRIALGAARSRVLRAVVGEGVALALAGAVLGIGGALAGTRLIAQYVYGVRTTDPATFMTVAGVLVIVAGVASYVPARRASAVDPLIALRAE